MSKKSCSIHSVFCLLVTALPFSVASAMQQQSQESNRGQAVGELPKTSYAIPPVAPSSFEEPVESGLFPESAEAIEWLNENFGVRVDGNDIDRWIAQDLDEAQLRAIAKKDLLRAGRLSSQKCVRPHRKMRTWRCLSAAFLLPIGTRCCYACVTVSCL